MGSVVEAHEGNDALYSLPNDPIIAKLVQQAQRIPTEPMIHDSYGFNKSYPQLLGDAMRTRESILKILSPALVDEHGFLKSDAPYICVLASSGYEFLVAFFAIRGLNGAPVPFGKLCRSWTSILQQ